MMSLNNRGNNSTFDEEKTSLKPNGKDHGSINGTGDKLQLDETAANSVNNNESDSFSFSIKGKFTVEEAINYIGFGKFQVWLTFLCGLGIVAEAIEMMVLSILSPALACDWGVSSTEQALVTTFVFIGMMIGSTSWGIFCDTYGRKTGIVLSLAFTSFYGLLSSFSPSLGWIYILRGIMGGTLIGGSQAATTQIEFATTSSRTINLLITQPFWALGNFFVIGTAVGVMPALGWRWQLAICSIPLFLATVLTWIFLPKSARYQILSGQSEEALVTLKKIAKQNGQPMPDGELHAPPVDQIHRGSFSDLFKPELRRTTLTLWYLWFATSFSYYGVTLFTTELMNSPTGCPANDGDGAIAPCTLECTDLTMEDYIAILITTCAEFAVLPNAYFWMTILNRKQAMFAKYMIYTLFVCLLSTCLSKAAATGFVFIVRIFASSIFQIIYIYTLEVYPTSVRALGLGSCSSAARIGGIITPFIAQVLYKKSFYGAIGVYGTVGFLGAITALLLPIETKGRHMHDVTVEKEE